MPPTTPTMPGAGLLDFGTSVSVNDEMRRGLVTESEHLSASLKNLGAGLTTQTKVHDQLGKDAKLAWDETQAMVEGATETVAKLVLLTEKVLAPLVADTLLSQLGLPPPSDEAQEAAAKKQEQQVDDKPQEQEQEQQQQQEPADTPEADENAPPPLDEEEDDDEDVRRMPPPQQQRLLPLDHSMAGIRETRKLRQEECLKLFEQVSKFKQARKELRAQALTVEAQHAVAAELVANLKKQVSKVEKKTKSYERGRRMEEARSQSFAAKYATLQENYATLSQATQVLAQESESLQKEHAEQLDTLQAEVSALEGTKVRHAQDLASQKQEINDMETHVATLAAEYAQYTAWQTAFGVQQQAREEERQERLTRFSALKALEDDWSARKAEVLFTEKHMVRAEQQVRQADEELHANQAGFFAERAAFDKVLRETAEWQARVDALDAEASNVQAEQRRLQYLEEQWEAVSEQAQATRVEAEREHRHLAKERQVSAAQLVAVHAANQELTKRVETARRQARRSTSKEKRNAQLKRSLQIHRYAVQKIQAYKAKEGKILKESTKEKSTKEKSAKEKSANSKSSKEKSGKEKPAKVGNLTKVNKYSR